MSGRVLVFCLAFVLLCAGFTKIETPRIGVASSPEHVSAHAGPASLPAPAGSLEEHHLDDLPLQAPGDAPSDVPGLLPASLTLSAPSLRMAPPRALAAVAARAPFIDGPLRPPRDTPLAA